MKTCCKKSAWEMADRLFPTDYIKDEFLSDRAGYPIYRHSTLFPRNVICDLETRLEITVNNETTNIWYS